MPTIGQSSCKCKENISAVFGSHNISPPVYTWQPKSVPFTQHNPGKPATHQQCCSGPAPPNYKPAPEICKDDKLCKCICQVNISSGFAAHNIMPPVYKDPIQSIPFTQHVWCPRPSKCSGEAPPPSGFSCAICKYGHNSCVCKTNDSATYSQHNISPPVIINPTLGTPFSGHHLGPVNTRSQCCTGPMPPRSNFGCAICHQGVSSCICKEPKGAPYVQHILDPPKIVNDATLAAPFVSHATIFAPKPSTCPPGPAPPRGGFACDVPCADDGTRSKQSCVCPVPSNTPFTQHVLDLPMAMAPTLGIPFAQHESQALHAPCATGCGGGPALAGVNTLFDSSICEKDHRWKVSSIPFTQHTLILDCPKNCAVISLPFASHGVYPETEPKNTCHQFVSSPPNCDINVASLPYGQHKLCTPKVTPFGEIENKSCKCGCFPPKYPHKCGVTIPEPTCPPPVRPFGMISNDNLCKGEKPCTPFGEIQNAFGPGIKEFKGRKVTQMVCPVKSAPFVQHSKYKQVSFGQITNNPP